MANVAIEYHIGSYREEDLIIYKAASELLSVLLELLNDKFQCLQVTLQQRSGIYVCRS